MATKCIDGMLWVGQTYPKFFCGDAMNCVNPARPQGPHCFVHEADIRGISRRIPRVPKWAVPGETRIFLAHRGGEQDSALGRIFGYFVLERIEVIATPDSLPHPNGHRAKPIRKGTPLKVPPKGKPTEPEPDEDEPKVKARECWNGKVIVTAVYDPKSQEWRPTGEECPEPPDLGDEDDDEGESEDGGLVFLPADEEKLAEHRGCSLRAKPGAVYVVDSLEAEIADSFVERLEEGSTRKRQALEEAHMLFDQVVEAVAPRHAALAEVPDLLRGKAHARGELVLFDDPPLLEHQPQASFRGLAHIDGENLLEQIARGAPKPEIRHCSR